MDLTKTIIAVGAGALIMGAVALADDAFVADCEEFKATNGIEGDCECMAEEAVKADVAAEIEATTTLDDLDGLSEAAKQVVEACT